VNHTNKKVRCGWDPSTLSRREVALPDLTNEQKRRNLYFFLDDQEAANRLAKLDAQVLLRLLLLLLLLLWLLLL